MGLEVRSLGALSGQEDALIHCSSVYIHDGKLQ